MKETQKNNGLKCSEMEYLDIEIFNHFLKVYYYIIWNKKHLLGEVVEDDMMKLLDKDQLIDFYHAGKYKFKVKKSKIEKYLKRNDK
jgi:hypothetical protein